MKNQPNLRFRACRINGTAFVELFEGNAILALVWKQEEPNKERWDQLYEVACAEAERLNLALKNKETKE